MGFTPPGLRLVSRFVSRMRTFYAEGTYFLENTIIQVQSDFAIDVWHSPLSATQDHDCSYKSTADMMNLPSEERA